MAKQDSTQRADKILRPKDLCPKCGKNEGLGRRNYDMKWGEAELWCNDCNLFIRDLDYG